MPDQPTDASIIRVSDLSPRKPHRFERVPDPAELLSLAERLDLLALRKLRFKGELSAHGKHDWRLEGRLGATVIQPCVLTLEPVTTRIEEKVVRTFLKSWPPETETGDEVEMPEDETIDPLPAELDLNDILEEALALAIPVYPRAEGAEAVDTLVAPPGAGPLTDEAVRPFAGLSELKKKLEDNGD